MSFRSVLKKIETDIEIGINAAAPIIDAFDPQIGLILTAIGKGLAVLEKSKTDPNVVSPVIQSITTTCSIMQHKGACTKDQNCTACCCPSVVTW